MAYYFDEPSRTFNEYLLVPGHTPADCIPARVSLKTPLVKYRKGEEDCPLTLSVPMVSAIMAAVSDDKMAVALATEGGLSFIYGNQSIEDEAAMVARVKDYKAGFVTSDANLSPDMTLEQVVALKEQYGHSTMPVTDDGSAHGKLLGIVTERDYRLSRMSLDEKVADFMTPREKLVVAPDGTTLKAANDIIWDHKLNSLPIVDGDDRLVALVFRKDYDSHKSNPDEMLDAHKRYMVGAGINSRDYAERVPALVEAGADVLCIDSSEGYSDWQKMTIEWVREHYGDDVKIGAGNVVDAEGFRFLADAGADFVKIGIGGGSICITRETKGIGRGQATATIEVAKARDEYFRETGIYVPICSDGGIVYDHHARIGHGRRLRHAGPLLRPLRREPFGQGHGERHLHEGVLGRGECPRPQLGPLRFGRQEVAVLRRGRRFIRALRRQPEGQHGHHPAEAEEHHVQLRCAHDPRVPGQGEAHAGVRHLHRRGRRPRRAAEGQGSLREQHPLNRPGSCAAVCCREDGGGGAEGRVKRL